MSNIAILGVGAMGSRMAIALLKAGHAVTVWNRSPGRTDALVSAGAEAADNPRSAVRGVDFAISMVRDDLASQAVWLDPESGALSGLAENAVAIESSTLSVEWIRVLAGHCRAQGKTFLDAPVVGSLPQADAAQLIYLVGGEAEALARSEPVLRTMGGAVHHAGPTGSGAALKLAVNTLLGVQVAVVAELLSLMQGCGLKGERVVEILGVLPVCSPSAKAAAGSMLVGNFNPLFPIELVEKDLGFALAAAEETGSRLPMAEAARQVYAEAMTKGQGGDNMTGVVRLYTSQ